MIFPLVSVIVPVYRVEKYLRVCIESILNQSFSDLELILVDDGSPDNSGAICDEYARKDERVKVIHKPNGGVSSARNIGLDVACGKYIGFVDSDDWIEHEMYEKMVCTILSGDADICFCRVAAANEDGTRLENHRLFGHGKRIFSGREVLELLVKGGSTYYESVCNKLYKRELFSKLRFPEGKQHEDAFLVHHIYGMCNRVVFTEDILYNYRLRSDSIMRTKFSIQHLDAIDAFCERVEYCASENMVDTAAYALLQAVGKMLELFMKISAKDTSALKRSRNQIKMLRRIRKMVPLDTLSYIDKCKVLLGLYATPIYMLKLKLQGMQAKVQQKS